MQNSVDPDETARSGSTLCLYDIDFSRKSLFASMDISKFKDGTVHLRNAGRHSYVNVQFVAIALA